MKRNHNSLFFIECRLNCVYLIGIFEDLIRTLHQSDLNFHLYQGQFLYLGLYPFQDLYLYLDRYLFQDLYQYLDRYLFQDLLVYLVLLTLLLYKFRFLHPIRLHRLYMLFLHRIHPSHLFRLLLTGIRF